MKKTYGFYQIGYALHQVITKTRTDLTKPYYPEAKIQWIKHVTNKLMDCLENETRKFNGLNPGNELSANDLVSAVHTTLNVMLKAIGQKLIKS